MILKLITFFALLGAPLVAHDVVVSLAPHKSIVERIGGEEVSVGVIVPRGASPHTFEPTPAQAIALQKAKVWFRVGETFEHQLRRVLKMKVVDLRDGLPLIKQGCCCKEGHDTHIWLSPKLLQQQARLIAQTLTEIFPEKQPLFESNLEILLVELEALDQEIAKQVDGGTLLVAHPAFGYFCRDYGLKQLSVERDGKEPTAREIAALVAQAKKAGIKRLFVQEQYSQKGARLLAHQLDARISFLDPYAEDVIENLRQIARAVSS